MIKKQYENGEKNCVTIKWIEIYLCRTLFYLLLTFNNSARASFTFGLSETHAGTDIKKKKKKTTCE